MATVQIRELPDDAYETIRRRARAAGQSIQAYMRDQIVQMTARRSKDEAWAAVESALGAQESTGLTLTDVIADLDRDRR